MLSFVVRRLLIAVATLVLVTMLVFVLVHLGDGSPGAIAIGQGGTPDEIDAYNEKVGWNGPWAAQYLDWVTKAVQGDLGVSFTDGRDVGRDILSRLPITGALAVGATLVSTALGVILGVTAAVRGGVIDRLVGLGTALVVALPSFWIGIVFVYLLAIQTSLLPATGYVPFEVSPTAWFASLVLPVLTLALGGAAFIARQTRASMIEALAQEHIRTLRAVATPAWRILYVHALRFASLPIAASVALQFIALFSGAVIVEQLFAMPGLGSAIQGAVGSSDSSTIQGVVVVTTAIVVLVNFLLEFATRLLDPRLRK